MRTGRSGLKTTRSTTASNAMTTSVAEEAGNVSLAGDNKAHSDGGSGKDKYSNNMPSIEGRDCSKKLLYYGYR